MKAFDDFYRAIGDLPGQPDYSDFATTAEYNRAAFEWLKSSDISNANGDLFEIYIEELYALIRFNMDENRDLFSEFINWLEKDVAAGEFKEPAGRAAKMLGMNYYELGGYQEDSDMAQRYIIISKGWYYKAYLFGAITYDELKEKYPDWEDFENALIDGYYFKLNVILGLPEKHATTEFFSLHPHAQITKEEQKKQPAGNGSGYYIANNASILHKNGIQVDTSSSSLLPSHIKSQLKTVSIVMAVFIALVFVITSLVHSNSNQEAGSTSDSPIINRETQELIEPDEKPKTLTQSLNMEQLIVDAQVLPDASMLVTERITVNFSGQWNGFYSKIPQGDTPITEVQVSENGQPYTFNPGTEYGPPGTFLTKYEGDNILIDWSFDAYDQVRTFDVSYRVINAVKIHSDVAEFYRKFVGEANGNKISYVQVNLTLPPGAEQLKQGEDIRIWGHGPLNGKVEFAGPGAVVLKVKDLSPFTFMEGRVVMPAALFRGAPAEAYTAQPALAKILAEEQGRRRSVE